MEDEERLKKSHFFEKRFFTIFFGIRVENALQNICTKRSVID
jgi:hypothetical protein